MITCTYRDFVITRGSPRQCWVAEHETLPVEIVHEDLGEVETAIDRWHDDQSCDAEYERVMAKLHALDATQEDNARIADGLAGHGRAA